MTQTNQNPPLYAGLNCKGIEFFTVESEMKFIADGQLQCTSKLPYGIVQLANEEIAKDKTVENALLELHPNSSFKRMNQFLHCRYGGLDYSADFKNNEFKDGDYFDCQKRNTCKFNGILCQAPKYKEHTLTAIEISLMKLLSTNLTNEVIAEKLKLAYGSFHKYKQILYAKLGVQTKPEIALIAKSLNLI